MDPTLTLRDRRNIARNVSRLDLLDLQKQGQDLYRREKYEEALRCFDQVCGPLHSPNTSNGHRQSLVTWSHPSPCLIIERRPTPKLADSNLPFEMESR